MSDGTYTIGGTTPGGPPGLAAGRYLMVVVDPTGRHQPAYLTDIDVVAGQATPVDAALDAQVVPAPTSSISGTVTDDATGLPVAGVWVPVIDHTGRLAAGAVSGAGGTYTAPVAAGDYRVAFLDPTGNHAGEWLDDQPLVDPDPLVLRVPPVGRIADVDADLGPSTGTITGTVTTTGTGTPVGGVWVLGVDARTGRPNGGATAATDGTYTLVGHRPGTPLVLAFVDPTGTHHFEYHHDTGDYFTATPITVTAGTTTIDEDLTPIG